MRDALGDVEADVAEGFARKNPGEFANFLRFALASLAEARTRLKDGVARGCFTDDDVAMSLVWDERARIALENLRDSQLRMAEKWRERAARAESLAAALAEKYGRLARIRELAEVRELRRSTRLSLKYKSIVTGAGLVTGQASSVAHGGSCTSAKPRTSAPAGVRPWRCRPQARSCTSATAAYFSVSSRYFGERTNAGELPYFRAAGSRH